MLKRVSLFVVLTAVALFWFCGEKVDHTNIFDSSYPGDYRFDASFITKLDTLSIFTPYVIKYKYLGTDTFPSFTISVDTANILDAILTRVSYKDSLITVYFKAPYSGNLTISGIRPNQQTVDKQLKVVVKNPFRISSTSGKLSATIGQSISLSISGSPSGKLSAKWFTDNTLSADTAANLSFVIKSDTVVEKRIFAIVRDSSNSSIHTDTISIKFAPKTPVVKFPQKNMEIPVNQEIAIPITLTDCDSVKWVIKGLTQQSTTTGSLKVTFADSGTDTIIATGFNRYGISSKPDTLYLKITEFNYTLKPVLDSFPDTVRTGHWYSWKIAVLKNGNLYSGSNITYEWKTTPDSSWDSIKITDTGTTLHLYQSDSIPQFLLNVHAIVGTDSTNWHSQNVIVRAFRPTCSFVTTDFNTAINVTNTITIKADDSNGDGSLTGIFYTTSDNSTPQSTGMKKSWDIRFSTPGLKTVKAYAIDNDGLVSDTAELKVNVTANKPYFVRSQLDTSVFINDNLKLVMTALPGNVLDSITAYKWDFNNDGKWDEILTTARFDTIFASPGTFSWSVGCQNSRGDSAASLAQVTIHVLDGAPKVKSVTCVPTLAYIGGQVAIKITASDTNGTVRKIAIKINGSADSIITVEAAPVIDTSVKFTFSTPGKYVISAAVIDEDKVKSPYVSIADTLIVSNGYPIAKGIKPDTVWVMDDTTYHIAATDVNGSVKSYFVKWDNAGSFEQFSDSVIKHKYLNSGKYHISMYVKDNDSLSSDTISDSVVVLQGKPSVKSVFADSVWINDTVSYKVRGTDPNGKITHWAVSWDNGVTYEITSDSVFSHSFITAGSKQLKMYVTDDDDISSDTLTVNVMVKLGKPVALPLFADTVWYNKSTAFTLRGSDPNGKIIQRAVCWGDSGSTFNTQADSNFTHKYTTEGLKHTRSYVIDDDGISSDTIQKDVLVRIGYPSVSSIVTNPAFNSIYIKDQIKFTIKGRDEDGSLDSLLVSWDGDTVFEDRAKATKDSAVFNYTFSRSDSGTKTLRFRAKDPDGFVKDSTLQITVLSGAPVIDSLNPRMTWINDTLTYTIYAHDVNPNGTLKKFFYDFNNDGIWDDSVNTNSFTAHFGSSGVKTVKIGVRDEDSVLTTATQTVNVHLGMPSVWNAQGDTMFVVCPDGGGNIKLHISNFDSNGTVKKFFWDYNAADGFDTLTPGLDGDTTQVDSVSLKILGPSVNIPFKMAVFGRDDDGNVAGDTFFLLPDAPPPTTTTTSDAVAGVRKISWSGKDARDGDGTLYKVVIKKGGSTTSDSITVEDESNPAYIVQDFKAGSLYDSGSPFDDFAYTFTPNSGTGTYHYRIISKDARGSIARSLGDSKFNFTQP